MAIQQQRTELVMHEEHDQWGVTRQHIAQETQYGCEISLRVLGDDRTPLCLLSRWTIPPEDMDQLAAWWQKGQA